MRPQAHVRIQNVQLTFPLFRHFVVVFLPPAPPIALFFVSVFAKLVAQTNI